MLPNFLILGASKCGTTALYHVLHQHPQIYMSPVKEPLFFAFGEQPPNLEGPGSREVRRESVYKLDQYHNLFAGAGDAIGRGEASPIYLSCYQPQQTAHNIRKHVPDMKMIALLRQPAERMWSAYCHQRRSGREPLPSLEEAIADGEHRARRNWVYALQYWRTSCFHLNLAPYMELFDRDQLRVYLYDEWNADPRRVLKEIFHFLGVDENFEPNVAARRNVGWLPRSMFVEKLCRRMQTLLPAPLYRRTFGPLHRANRTYPPIDPALRHQLTSDFAPHIHRLEEMLQRDLGLWLL